MRCVSESKRNELRYYSKRGISMAIRKRPDNAPEEMLEANRRQLEQMANACGEEAGLHRPLAEVERALERVREGAYGICEACGHRIPAARLKFQPSATRCVECQSLWDRLNGRTA